MTLHNHFPHSFGKLLFRLSALGLMVLLLATAVEFSIRWLFPACDPSSHIRFTWNEKYGFAIGQPLFQGRQWKNTGDFDVSVAINRYGFREAKDLKEAMIDDFLVVGDSFTFGWGVEEEERFSNVLARITGHRIFNIAAPASDIEGYRRLLSFAKEHNASAKNLIIAICMENDLGLYSASPGAPDKHTLHSNPFANLAALKEWLSYRSALYNCSARFLRRVPILNDQLNKLGLINGTYVFNNKANLVIIRSSASRVAQLSKDRRALILIIPSRGLWVGDNKASESKAHAYFVTALKAHGLRVVDMRPLFEKEGDPLSYYFKNDAHWNAKAHRLAAEALRDALKDLEAVSHTK